MEFRGGAEGLARPAGGHPAIAGARSTPTRGRRFQRVRQAVFGWPLKRIQSPDGDHEGYDPERDPREWANLVDRRPKVSRRLVARLKELEKSRAALSAGPDAVPLDEDLRRGLEGLGCIKRSRGGRSGSSVTAMKIGEIRHLRRRDIDMDQCWILVRAAQGWTTETRQERACCVSREAIELADSYHKTLAGC